MQSQLLHRVLRRLLGGMQDFIQMTRMEIVRAAVPETIALISLGGSRRHGIQRPDSDYDYACFSTGLIAGPHNGLVRKDIEDCDLYLRPAAELLSLPFCANLLTVAEFGSVHYAAPVLRNFLTENSRGLQNLFPLASYNIFFECVECDTETASLKQREKLLLWADVLTQYISVRDFSLCILPTERYRERAARLRREDWSVERLRRELEPLTHRSVKSIFSEQPPNYALHGQLQERISKLYNGG